MCAALALACVKRVLDSDEITERAVRAVEAALGAFAVVYMLIVARWVKSIVVAVVGLLLLFLVSMFCSCCCPCCCCESCGCC